ncbi:hypothetical protein [Accumulibacter sp.]
MLDGYLHGHSPKWHLLRL